MSVASANAAGRAASNAGMAEADTASNIESGALVWVACPERVWRSGRVVEKHGAAEFVVEFDESEREGKHDGEGGGEKITITTVGSKTGPPARRIVRRNAILLGDGALRVDDLTNVPELHEGALLHALDVRFANGVIYTLTGPVLLAVNPFRKLAGLYEQDQLRLFIGTDRPAPHVFGVAGLAFTNICERGESQTVLVSGESGSGKTETTKFVIQFLALAGAESAASGAARSPLDAEGCGPKDTDSVVSSRPRVNSRIGGGGSATGGSGSERMSRIERKVLGCNPLLEAFGNAKTLRNDNSSRFGKYIELQFCMPKLSFFVIPRFSGARIRTYLLEKVRVIRQQEGERSFHVFYQALAAANAEGSLDWESAHRDDRARPSVDLSGFGARRPSSFAYLTHRRNNGLDSALGSVSGCGGAAADGASAEVLLEDFDATLVTMGSVGFSLCEISDVFRAVAAVLLIGEIGFLERISETAEIIADDEEAAVNGRAGGDCVGSGKSALSCVSGLLGVDVEDLRSALCTRTMQAPREGRVIRMPNTAAKAADTRDALARHLYGAIFEHVVDRVNTSIGSQDEATFCGVLDIFGFEFFDVNSFEQLCINYTNELLQQYFNNFIFEMEASLYSAEGIAWNPLEFPHNDNIVALLHQKVTGLFPMLEEECFSIGGSSESWCNKVVREHANHVNFKTVKHKHGLFTVQHFAGPVEYAASGFLEKNRDELSMDLVQCLQRSERPFIQASFQAHERVFGVTGGAGAALQPSSVSGDTLIAPPRNVVTKAQRYSVSSEFRQQLQDLLCQIRATTPHFVRCIKPNTKNTPFVPETVGRRGRQEPKPWFDRQAVAEQLGYQGVLEAIRVSRAGYPVRLLHKEFVKDYLCLVSSDLRRELGESMCKSVPTDDSGRLVRVMLSSSQLKALLSPHFEKHGEGWAVGQTRIFLKQEPFGLLRNGLVQRRVEAATQLQAAQRGQAARQACKLRLWVFLRVQARWRGRAVRIEVRKRRSDEAARTFGSVLLTLLAQAQLRRTRSSAIQIQKIIRGRPTRASFFHVLANVRRVQRCWRSFVKRRRWRTIHVRILNVQRVWRGSVGRRKAFEVAVGLFRLRVALRKLINHRRRRKHNLAVRAEHWRLYTDRGFVPEAPERSAVITELLTLQQAYCSREEEIQDLHAEVTSLADRLEVLWGQACLTVRSMFGSPSEFPRAL
eukprot:TRINITY_DN28629_c0_g2_i1.p1 TRINITY_DN28629_c0_g2~~TRINITY_DN28629_c0_g2_i1.p1  ORF type:complete len:1196 (-),score=189.82 TRINITY_DN28629_c0_g2_i1:177-3764(-)